MKNIFNRLKKAESMIPASTAWRDTITGFIIQSLKPYVDEKSLSVSGLRLYIVCKSPEEEEAAWMALYLDKPGMFKASSLERKLLDHFIQLEPDWTFECKLIKDDLPENCLKQENLGLIVIRAGERRVEHFSKAMLEVLVGQAEQFSYILDPQAQLRFNIGRSKDPQLSSGKVQHNDIVFLARDEPGFDEHRGSANLHVSRNHAYIVYDPKNGQYSLYPDHGGLPGSGNKIKVHTADDKVKWLTLYGVGHTLQPGDQVELGGQAVLRFAGFAE